MKTKKVVALAIAVMSLMMLIPVGVNAHSKKSDGCEDVGDIFSDFCFGYDFGLGEINAVASKFGAAAEAIIDTCFGDANAEASVSEDGAKAGAAADIGFAGADADAWAKFDEDGAFKAGAKAGSFIGKLFGNAWATVEIDGCDVDFDFGWDCNWPEWHEWHRHPHCKPSCPKKSEPVVTDEPTVEPTVEPTTDPELDPVPKMGL